MLLSRARQGPDLFACQRVDDRERLWRPGILPIYDQRDCGFGRDASVASMVPGFDQSRAACSVHRFPRFVVSASRGSEQCHPTNPRCCKLRGLSSGNRTTRHQQEWQLGPNHQARLTAVAKTIAYHTSSRTPGLAYVMGFVNVGVPFRGSCPLSDCFLADCEPQSELRKIFHVSVSLNGATCGDWTFRHVTHDAIGDFTCLNLIQGSDDAMQGHTLYPPWDRPWKGKQPPSDS